MEKLESVAKRSGWFADVLADPGLILGIRKNYMNVYRLGQSLFKIERDRKTGALKFSTHPKYLVDPELYKAVPFDGSAFMIDKLEPLVKEYTGLTTLNRMKRAAKLYCGDEKVGVQAVVLANPNVIDTEIAFSREAEPEAEKGRSAPRIDLACLEEVERSIRLRFWEAKLYTNPAILAAGETLAGVVEQVRGYQDLVQKHWIEIAESYCRVSRNLVDMVRWVDSPRKVGALVKRVADGEPIVVDKRPIVGLIIYGYDEAQKTSAHWKTHIGKLRQEPHMPVLLAGDAKNIHLVAGAN
jgi:hypothetical protein